MAETFLLNLSEICLLPSIFASLCQCTDHHPLPPSSGCHFNFFPACFLFLFFITIIFSLLICCCSVVNTTTTAVLLKIHKNCLVLSAWMFFYLLFFIFFLCLSDLVITLSLHLSPSYEFFILSVLPSLSPCS